jgi:hypothetical protein
MSILEIISIIVSIGICTILCAKLFNSLRTIDNSRRTQERRTVAEMMSRIQGVQGANPEERESGETGITGTSSGITGIGGGITGVAGVAEVARVRLVQSLARVRPTTSPKPKSGDRYELLLKKEKGSGKDPKSPAKGRSRYDLLKNKE